MAPQPYAHDRTNGFKGDSSLLERRKLSETSETQRLKIDSQKANKSPYEQRYGESKSRRMRSEKKASGGFLDEQKKAMLAIQEKYGVIPSKKFKEESTQQQSIISQLLESRDKRFQASGRHQPSSKNIYDLLESSPSEDSDNGLYELVFAKKDQPKKIQQVTILLDKPKDSGPQQRQLPQPIQPPSAKLTQEEVAVTKPPFNLWSSTAHPKEEPSKAEVKPFVNLPVTEKSPIITTAPLLLLPAPGQLPLAPPLSNPVPGQLPLAPPAPAGLIGSQMKPAQSESIGSFLSKPLTNLNKFGEATPGLFSSAKTNITAAAPTSAHHQPIPQSGSSNQPIVVNDSAPNPFSLLSKPPASHQQSESKPTQSTAPGDSGSIFAKTASGALQISQQPLEKNPLSIRPFLSQEEIPKQNQPLALPKLFQPPPPVQPAQQQEPEMKQPQIFSAPTVVKSAGDTESKGKEALQPLSLTEAGPLAKAKLSQPDKSQPAQPLGPASDVRQKSDGLPPIANPFANLDKLKPVQPPAPFSTTPTNESKPAEGLFGNFGQSSKVGLFGNAGQAAGSTLGLFGKKVDEKETEGKPSEKDTKAPSQPVGFGIFGKKPESASLPAGQITTSQTTTSGIFSGQPPVTSHPTIQPPSKAEAPPVQSIPQIESSPKAGGIFGSLSKPKAENSLSGIFGQKSQEKPNSAPMLSPKKLQAKPEEKPKDSGFMKGSDEKTIVPPSPSGSGLFNFKPLEIKPNQVQQTPPSTPQTASGLFGGPSKNQPNPDNKSETPKSILAPSKLSILSTQKSQPEQHETKPAGPQQEEKKSDNKPIFPGLSGPLPSASLPKPPISGPLGALTKQVSTESKGIFGQKSIPTPQATAPVGAPAIVGTPKLISNPPQTIQQKQEPSISKRDQTPKYALKELPPRDAVIKLLCGKCGGELKASAGPCEKCGATLSKDDVNYAYDLVVGVMNTHTIKTIRDVHITGPVAVKLFQGKSAKEVYEMEDDDNLKAFWKKVRSTTLDIDLKERQSGGFNAVLKS